MQQLIDLLNSIKLPIEIPLLMHSPVVHFAIAIPIIALLLEIVNIFIKRRCVGVISSLLLLLAVVVYFAAFFTGKTDGSEAYSLLSADGKEELKAHKLLGTYLLFGISALFVLKLIFATLSSRVAKIIFTLILAVFVGFALKQGKDGGELVFKYGANVQALSAMDDKVMELEDALDNCKSKLQECQSQKAAKPTAKKPSAPSQEASSSTATSSSIEASSQSSQASSEEAIEEVSVSSSSEATIQEKAKAALEQIKGTASSAVSSVQEHIKSTLTQEAAPSEQTPEQPSHE